MKSRASIALLTFSIMGVLVASFGFLLLADHVGNRTLNSLSRTRGTLAALRQLQVATHSLQAERADLHETTAQWKTARLGFAAQIKRLKTASIGSRENDSRIERIAETWSRMEELNNRVESALDKLARRGVFERIGPAGLLLGYDRGLADLTFNGEDLRDLGIVIQELEDFDNTAREVGGELQSITESLSVDANNDIWYKVLAQTLAFLTAVLGIRALLHRVNKLYRQLAVDNAARKAAETAARSSAEDLRLTLNSIGDAVIATDLKSRITRMNPVAEQLTGWKSSEALGEPLAEVFRIVRPRNKPADGGSDPAETKSPLNRLTAVTLVRRDGTEKNIAESAAPLRAAQGELLGHVYVFHDVTEQLHLQEQLWQAQKLDSIGKLAGGVAHDFNNILTVIQGHLSLISIDPAVTRDVRESLKEIGEATTRAANLTRQLLTFSRRHNMQVAPLDLNEVVNNMIKMLRRIVSEDVSLNVHYAKRATMVEADISMMEQVLMNLVVNARDAMPNGGQLAIETSILTVDAATAAETHGARTGDFACLSVTDTGTGMSADVIDKIFDPFFTTKNVGKGTGLGLATVYGIVQQHKGWIQVTSQLGQGSTFRVYLPHLAGQPPEENVLPVSTHVVTADGHETLLLVEDEPSLRKLICNALTSRGYTVWEAASGVKALDVWKEHRAQINLLVTDMVMPDGLSGFELAKQLMADNPRLKVIYTTGYSPEIAGGDFKPQEGVNFIAKPFIPDKLALLIRRVLDTASWTDLAAG